MAIDDDKLNTAESEKGNFRSINASVPVRRFARNVVWGGIALVLFIVFFIIFWKKENQHTVDKSSPIVLMGDSIFANTCDETSVASLLSDKLGVTVTDVSFGGTCMSYIDRDARLDYATDAYCMAALTQAVLAEDFRYQDNAYIRVTATDYYDERLDVLKHIDFSQVDILIIDYLLNDYQIAVPVNCGSDSYDEYTFEGAYRSVISSIREKYPDLRIILVAPVRTWYEDERIPSDEKDIGGGTIDVYIECQREIAEEFELEWISLYELYDKAVKDKPELLTDENGEALKMWEAFTLDNVHPNETARELIAEYIYEYLSDGE